MSLAMPFTALRWRALLDPARRNKSGVGFLTGLLCTGFALNHALPGPAGDVLAVVAVRRRSGIDLSEGLGALAIGRVLGLATAAVLAGLSALVTPASIPPQWQVLMQGAAAMLLLCALILALALLRPDLPRKVATAMIRPFEGRGSARRQAQVTGVRERVVAFTDGLVLATRRGPRPLVAAATWALGAHLSTALGIAMVAGGLGLDIPLGAVIFSYATTVAGSVALFLLPGSHLGFDVAFAALLSLVGSISGVDAVAVAGVIRVQQTLVTLAGVAGLWLLFRTLLPKQLATDLPPVAGPDPT